MLRYSDEISSSVVVFFLKDGIFIIYYLGYLFGLPEIKD